MLSSAPVRRRWPICALVAIAFVPAVPGSAHAADPALPLELSWDAPAQCPEASIVVHRVEQLVRGNLLETPKVVASARIESAPNGGLHLALTLRTGGVEETRALEGPSCSALAEATAVVIALAIDPSSLDAPAPIEAAPAAPDPVPPASTPVAPAPPPKLAPAADAPSTQSRARPLRIAVGLGASADVGSLPSVGAGLVGAAGVRFHRFRAGILGNLWSRQSPMFGASGGASFDMIELGAFGAYMIPLGPIAIGPGAAIEATYMRVQGFGIRAPRSSSTLWPSAVAGARLEVPLGRWLGLFSRADALFPIGAPIFTLPTSGEAVHLHQPSRVCLRLSLGLEIVLP